MLDPVTASPSSVAKREPRKPALTLAESRHFKLTDYDLDPADEMELWANLIETAALCSRLARKRLTQVRPLSGIADLTPPLSKRSIADLTDLDLACLVANLRENAERMRAKTPIASFFESERTLSRLYAHSVPTVESKRAG